MHAFSPLFVDRKYSFESLPTFKHLFLNNAIPCVLNSRNRKIGTRASQRRVDEKSGLLRALLIPERNRIYQVVRRRRRKHLATRERYIERR